jgi:hypothetical protein
LVGARASGALPRRFDERLIERSDRPPAARQGTALVALEPPQLTHQLGPVDLARGALIRISDEVSKGGALCGSRKTMSPRTYITPLPPLAQAHFERIDARR